ncbi:MAG: class I SAM-dependent methyltransferase [Holosporales bacterium]|nr:class I SAM-dependent methyltransferase [Holosporales bacterium]
MKYILRSLLRSTGYDIFRVKFQTHENCEYSTITPYASYSPWLNDTNFQSVYQIVKANTLVDVYRCYELWQTVAQSQHVEGDILEVGVWRGGTGCLIAKQAPNKTVYLCDTFEGVVKAGENDSGYTGGEHADTSQNIVNKLADTLNVKNISILKGIFPEETGHKIKSKKFSFCHIDVDTYQSARDTFDWVWPKLSTGGIVIFDDYGFYNCAGVTKIVNEERGKPNRIVLHNLNGHGIIIKI